ncbi:unnamed protein product [Wuchereria bancrofti]|uniref:Uncharacterized protein n=1 Tax=Wuchereria bancrofti TaxID=6293 RepID=A0A3P7DLF6_WUCBA|nr:unnamed protein product [Wuchereria bancrofti]
MFLLQTFTIRRCVRANTRKQPSKQQISLLFKKINVVSPRKPTQGFGTVRVGSQLSFISTARNRFVWMLKTCFVTKMNANRKRGITILETVANYWKQADTLIGAIYLFKFIQLNKIKNLKSEFSLLHSKIGSMIAIFKNNPIPKMLKKHWNNLNKISLRNKRNVFWPKVTLNDNCDLFLTRLKPLIKQLQTNSQLHSRNSEIIQKQLPSNIIEEVSSDVDQNDITHYLSNHAVLTLNKFTTKLRIIYDASAHFKGMKNLNDVLYHLRTNKIQKFTGDTAIHYNLPNVEELPRFTTTSQM